MVRQHGCSVYTHLIQQAATRGVRPWWIVIEGGLPGRVSQIEGGVMKHIHHVQELALTRSDQQGGMARHVSRRFHGLNAWHDLPARLHEVDPVVDGPQTSLCRGHKGLAKAVVYRQDP